MFYKKASPLLGGREGGFDWVDGVSSVVANRMVSTPSAPVRAGHPGFVAVRVGGGWVSFDAMPRMMMSVSVFSRGAFARLTAYRPAVHAVYTK